VEGGKEVGGGDNMVMEGFRRCRRRRCRRTIGGGMTTKRLRRNRGVLLARRVVGKLFADCLVICNPSGFMDGFWFESTSILNGYSGADAWMDKRRIDFSAWIGRSGTKKE